MPAKAEIAELTLEERIAALPPVEPVRLPGTRTHILLYPVGPEWKVAERYPGSLTWNVRPDPALRIEDASKPLFDKLKTFDVTVVQDQPYLADFDPDAFGRRDFEMLLKVPNEPTMWQSHMWDSGRQRRFVLERVANLADKLREVLKQFQQAIGNKNFVFQAGAKNDFRLRHDFAPDEYFPGDR